tara:strand:- start:14143 stop:14352 length:210 start_codon:yes stop_codon:yes gene_type:complete
MEDFVIFVLFFVLGVVIGIYIMTQVESKYEKNRVNDLLDLEDLLATTYKVNTRLKEEIKSLEEQINSNN